jgi:NDP-sugar pyrophosphorylase family protein
MRKTRISMTISGDVLRKLDSIVDGETVRSRSEAIESILNQYLEANKVAVILGGGDPEKLKLDGILRPLIKIRGKYLIEHNIETLRKSGFRKIFLIGRNEMIGECFKILGNGSKYMVDVKYIEEQKSLGNAKTLQLAETHVNSPFLVLPIDNFFDFDLNYLVKVHMSNPGLVTLAVQAGRASVSNLGVVEMVGDQIIGYEEKPSKPKTFLTSTFIGMYDPGVFEYIPKGNVKWVLQTNFFPRLIGEGRLYGCLVPGAYVNIHTKGDFRKISNISNTKVLSSNK